MLHLVVEIAALLQVVAVVGRKADGSGDVGERCGGVGEGDVHVGAFGVRQCPRGLVLFWQMLECQFEGGEGVAVFVVVEVDGADEEMGVAVARILFECGLELAQRFVRVFVVLQHFDAALHVVVLGVLALLCGEWQHGGEKDEQPDEQAEQRTGGGVCHRAFVFKC